MSESDRYYHQEDYHRHKSRESQHSREVGKSIGDNDRRHRGANDPNHSRSNQRSHQSAMDRNGFSPPVSYAESPEASSEHYEPEYREALYNLRYLGTGRGICQALEAFLNLLIIICAGVSHSSAGGYRDLASLGGLYHYYYGGANAFTGAEADRVKQLDRQFYELKLPPYVFSMACGGALMVYAFTMLALGVFRVPYRWPVTLLVEAVLNGLIGLGYLPAVAFYFIKLQDTYNHPICKEREQLYKSKGHQGFECSFHGADIAGGLFGVLGIALFLFGAVLAIKAFRAVRERKRQKALDNSQL